MKQSRLFLRNIILASARVIGTEIIDQRTGEKLGRALLLPWRGKIHVIGLDAAVRIFWVPQKRLTYWKQEIAFTTHAPVDFANVRDRRQPSGAKAPDSD